MLQTLLSAITWLSIGHTEIEAKIGPELEPTLSASQGLE